MFGKLEYLDKAAGAEGGGWGWLQYVSYINENLPKYFLLILEELIFLCTLV